VTVHSIFIVIFMDLIYCWAHVYIDPQLVSCKWEDMCYCFWCLQLWFSDIHGFCPTAKSKGIHFWVVFTLQQ